VVLGVELGITISLAISVLWIIKKTSLPHLAILGKMPNTNKFKDISQFTQAKPIEALRHLHFRVGRSDAPLAGVSSIHWAGGIYAGRAAAQDRGVAVLCQHWQDQGHVRAHRTLRIH
jgi:hypothetical protein